MGSVSFSAIGGEHTAKHSCLGTQPAGVLALIQPVVLDGVALPVGDLSGDDHVQVGGGELSARYIRGTGAQHGPGYMVTRGG